MSHSATLTIILFSLAASSSGDMDRSAIAQKIKAGDHRAFEKFFDEHYEPLLRFLLSKNTEREVAKDIIQKAFVYIWEHRQKIDPDKSLRSYMFQIAYSRMLNFHRDNQKFNNDKAVPERQTGLTPEDDARGKELEKAIDRAIDAMPEKRGTVFQLCFMEDFTYREAAEALDVTKKTVENHMGLALKDMRKSLQNFR